MKRCYKCGETKPRDLFYPNRVMKDGLGTECKKCRIEMAAIRVYALRERVNELKNKPCMDCGGVFPPVCMDYDHRDPATKSFEIGKFNSVNSWAKLLIEIEKCDLICSNCHRLRSQKQRLAGMFPRKNIA